LDDTTSIFIVTLLMLTSGTFLEAFFPPIIFIAFSIWRKNRFRNLYEDICELYGKSYFHKGLEMMCLKYTTTTRKPDDDLEFVHWYGW